MTKWATILSLICSVILPSWLIADNEQVDCAFDEEHLLLDFKENGTLRLSIAGKVKLEDCCFTLLDNRSSTLIIEKAHHTALTTIPFSLQMFARSPRDDEVNTPFFADFDEDVDRTLLRRDVYNLSERYPLVTSGQRILNRRDNVTMTSLSSSLPKEGKTIIAFGCGIAPPSKENQGDDNLICVGDSGLVFATRISPMNTRIQVLEGELTLLVTSPSNISLLRPFPTIHALHCQSQLLPSPNAKRKSIPVLRLDLGAGDFVEIPAYHGYRQIVTSSVPAVWIKTDQVLQSKYWAARVAGLAALPRMLQPNALDGQPLFFGLWCLAVYSDALFGFQAGLQSRASATQLLELVEARWGVESYRLGHADDRRDYGTDAQETIQAVREECEEMKVTPKDLMLRDRAKIETDVLTAAVNARSIFLEAVSSAEDAKSALFLELALDHLEIATETVIGGVGAREFFQCYFALEL